jgi:hypothetical protein
MREICIHIPPNKLEARLVDIRWNQNQSGPPVEVPICPSLPIDAAQFAQNKPLDPAAIRGLFTANHESPDFPARGRDLLAELGAGPAWWEVFQQTGELRSYLCVEHPLLRELPWELLTYNVNPLFSSSPWTRVQGWPLTHAPSNPVWPIRVFVIDGTDPEDKALTADSEIWGIRCALRAAEHSFDLEVLRTGIDPNFDVARLEDLMTRMEDGVRKWPGGPHILHFIGHSVAGAAPALRLFVPDQANPPGTNKVWTRTQIAHLMPRLSELRLVYLNACRSNVTGTDPMAPMSASEAFLVGAKAAIAMQADVRGPAAALCAEKFYSALASGDDPDVALLKARGALLLADNEESPNMYTPVMTTRVAAGDILPQKQFKWTPADHSLWQNGLRLGTQDKGKDNWAHFVDQRPRRRDLITGLLAAKPPAPLLVHGDTRVGKTWLLRWTGYALALNGLKTIYVDADAGMDWLEVLRRIRDGTKAPYSPGISTALGSEFNWKLNHIARGQTPVGTPPAVEQDTAGTLVEIFAAKKANNGFEALVCDAMANALRSESQLQSLVLVLDDLSMASLTVLKAGLLDPLLSTATIGMVLCLSETHLANAKKLGLDPWKDIEVKEIDVLLARDLAREIVRLRFPGADTGVIEASVTSVISVPSKIGVVYDTCVSLAELRGLR